MNRKLIIPLTVENTRIPKSNGLTVDNSRVIPMVVETSTLICPKCKKHPLRCPDPKNCGLENL